MLTYAIYKEVEAGRGTPHGGVYLSFQHIDAQALTGALGPVIGIFKRNNIDLTKRPVEVFPIAHYQMGGIEVSTDMASCVPGLYAAGEITGGANGANRLSGNALPEAMVFGERAGASAAKYALQRHALQKNPACWHGRAAAPHLDLLRSLIGRNHGRGAAPNRLMRELKDVMWREVGAFRDASKLSRALDRIRVMRRDLDTLAVSAEKVHNVSLVEWFELRNGLHAAEAAAIAAFNRRESRGAHQRDDFPRTRDEYQRNQRISLSDGRLVSSFQDDGP
jgi:succinate dehydrogenase/fumarate reductase flavoprotein subunit